MAKGEDNPIKYVKIDAANGNTEAIPLVSGHRFRVLGYTLIATSACTVIFQDGAGGTALTGTIPLAANGGISVTPTYIGCFETATEGTILNIAATGDVDGHLTYQEFTELTA